MALFVFGAGATRGASFVDPKIDPCLPPLDNDFFTQLQKVCNQKHRPIVKKNLKNIVRLFGHNFDVTLETVFTTIEHTLQMVKLTGKSGREFHPSDVLGMKKDLMQAVAVVLEDSLTVRKGGHSTLKPHECVYHRNIVENLLMPGDVVISFNYDCLLDYALKDFGNNKWNARYGYDLPLGGGGHRLSGEKNWQPKMPASRKQTVKLYKLHGSMNFLISKSDTPEATTHLKCRPYTKQFGDLHFTIIPPEWHKKYDKGVFAELWKKAAAAINREKQVVVLGYSLPLSDMHSSTLFRTSIKDRSLRSLVVVNPDKNARRRTRSVFQRGITDETKIISVDSLADFVALPRQAWDW